MRVAVRADEDGLPPGTEAESDVDLVQRMRAGDREALGALYDRHASSLLAVAVRMLGAAREAHDLLHDVFLEAWEHAGGYDAARGSVRAWLFVRLRSRALDRLGRVESLRVASLEDDAGGVLKAWSARAAYSEAVDALAVRQALSRAPEDVREVLALTYFEGLTAKEISARAGVPLGTVKSRLARGLTVLASLLDTKDSADGIDGR